MGRPDLVRPAGIEAAGCVHPWNLDVIRQAAPAAAWFWGELAQHPVGLVEQQGGQEAWRARHRLTMPIEIISRPRSIDTGGRTIGVAGGGTGTRRDPSGSGVATKLSGALFVLHGPIA